MSLTTSQLISCYRRTLDPYWVDIIEVGDRVATILDGDDTEAIVVHWAWEAQLAGLEGMDWMVTL